tara:strand:- start:502 stop:756 length:255 start_codon:yes stop_codon:yes gene_type:complete
MIDYAPVRVSARMAADYAPRAIRARRQQARIAALRTPLRMAERHARRVWRSHGQTIRTAATGAAAGLAALIYFAGIFSLFALTV